MSKVPPVILGLCLIIAIAFAGALALTSHRIPSNLWDVIFALVGGTAVASPTPASSALISKSQKE